MGNSQRLYISLNSLSKDMDELAEIRYKRRAEQQKRCLNFHSHFSVNPIVLRTCKYQINVLAA